MAVGEPAAGSPPMKLSVQLWMVALLIIGIDVWGWLGVQAFSTSTFKVSLLLWGVYCCAVCGNFFFEGEESESACVLGGEWVFGCVLASVGSGLKVLSMLL